MKRFVLEDGASLDTGRTTPQDARRYDFSDGCPNPVKLTRTFRGSAKAHAEAHKHGVRVVVRTTSVRGLRLRLACKRRRCEVCGLRWKKRAMAIVAAGLRGRVPGALLVTLTAPGTAGGLIDVSTIGAWNLGGPKRWNHFITILRRAFPAARIEFYRVAELQGRGAIHYHNIIVGVNFIPHDLLRDLAVRAGFGPVCDVRPVHNSAGGVAYVSKYLLKDVDSWPAGRRVWSCSAGWKDPQHWKAYLGAHPPGTFLVVSCDGEVLFVSVSPWIHESGERGVRRDGEFEAWVRKQWSNRYTGEVNDHATS